MKKVLFLLAAAAFTVASCSDNDSTGTHDGHEKSGSMIDNYKKIIKAIETGDSAALAGLIAEDAVDHEAGENGADVKGAEIVRDLSEVHRAFDGLKMDVEEVAANEDHVFAVVHMTGTTKESGAWGMPPNTKVDTRSIDVVKMKNGKATDHWTYVSPAEMMKAMQSQPEPADTLQNR